MGLPQAYVWSLLSQYIVHCPESNPRINFNIFPLVNVTNQKNWAAQNLTSSVFFPCLWGSFLTISVSVVSNNITSQFSPGHPVNITWEATGMQRGPPEQGGYVTAVSPTAGSPKFLAYIHQLNVTYTPLENVDLASRTASTTFPDFKIFNQTHGFNVNGTVFIAITDDDVPLTPFNLSLINNHTLAVGRLNVF
jgi:hypothetical protein